MFRRQKPFESTLSYQREAAYHRAQQERKRRSSAAAARRRREEEDAKLKRIQKEHGARKQLETSINYILTTVHDSQEKVQQVEHQDNSDDDDSFDEFVKWKQQQKALRNTK